LSVLAAFFALVLGLSNADALGPDSIAMMVRRSFEGGMAKAPPGHEALEAKVKILENLDYGSASPDGFLDLYTPSEAEGSLPLILWVHGGAYVGGDKEDNRILSVQLAARGYAVAVINYRRAPEALYPSPLLQIGEAWRFLSLRADSLGLDLGRVFLAGDSAGAQMIAQWAFFQADPEYARRVGIEPVAKGFKFRGLLLFCGPYDLGLLAGEKDPVKRYIYRRLGWAYFGDKAWSRSEAAALASVVDHIPRGAALSLPPVFITDANTHSFEEHGRLLAERLEAAGVPVSMLFFPRSEVRIWHEYQFRLDTLEGRRCLETVLGFLETHSE